MTALAPAAPELSLRLLGRLEVQKSGQPAALPASKKSRALLAYLVATARPQLRERLCELLWEAPDDPRASLLESRQARPLVDAGKSRLIGDRDFLLRTPKERPVELRAELGRSSGVDEPSGAAGSSGEFWRGSS
jgi:hypothetical protein